MIISVFYRPWLSSSIFPCSFVPPWWHLLLLLFLLLLLWTLLSSPQTSFSLSTLWTPPRAIVAQQSSAQPTSAQYSPLQHSTAQIFSNFNLADLFRTICSCFFLLFNLLWALLLNGGRRDTSWFDFRFTLILKRTLISTIRGAQTHCIPIHELSITGCESICVLIGQFFAAETFCLS